MIHSIAATTPDHRSPQPKGNAWSLASCFKVHGEIVHRWASGDVIACASRHEFDEPNKAGLLIHKVQFQVSISVGGRRATDDEIRGVLADFGFEGAEEDNHSSGLARHFWLDEGRTVQPECPCKATEETVVEPDGYRWQRTRGEH
jgi:hypothetical protein